MNQKPIDYYLRSALNQVKPDHQSKSPRDFFSLPAFAPFTRHSDIRVNLFSEVFSNGKELFSKLN